MHAESDDLGLSTLFQAVNLEKKKEGSQDVQVHEFLKSCREGRLETIHKLLSTPNFNVNSTDFEGDSGLHRAAAGAHTKAAHMLLVNGASIDLANKHGHTPLMVNVAQCPNEQFIRLLVGCGCDLSAVSKARILCAAVVITAQRGETVFDLRKGEVGAQINALIVQAAEDPVRQYLRECTSNA